MIDNTTDEQLERSLVNIDWTAYRRPAYTPSPIAWEDQVLYFLMLDRYSDGKETGYSATQAILLPRAPHCHEIYRFIADVTSLRSRHLALRRGRQYLQEIFRIGRAGQLRSAAQDRRPVSRHGAGRVCSTTGKSCWPSIPMQTTNGQPG